MKFTPTVVILGIVAAIIIVVVVVFARKGSLYQSTASPSPAFEEVTQVISNVLEASDQVATNSAEVSKVSLAEGGYVVVHASAADGTPGAVIGYTNYLEPGEYAELTVTLTKPVKVGDTIFPMLHSDDGDKTYGFPDEDLPLKDSAGAVILKKVKVLAP